MPYHMDRDDGPNGTPSLPEMVHLAIRILEKNSNGFFLFVESTVVLTFNENIHCTEVQSDLIKICLTSPAENTKNATVQLMKLIYFCITFRHIADEKIDDGHHMGAAVRAVSEVLPLEQAVKEGLNMTDEQNTLIVVSADHSHNMVFSGYPLRGNPIFGRIYVLFIFCSVTSVASFITATPIL